MDILPVNFVVLRYCGAWNEREDSNFIVRLLKFVYRYAVVALIYHFTLSEVIELLLPRENIEDLTDALFMTLTYVVLCFKYGNFLVRKEQIQALLQLFRTDTCQSKNAGEQAILDRCSHRAKWCTLSFMIMSQMTGVALVSAPLLSFQEINRTLPLPMYVPYPVSNLTPYLATYLYQIFAMFYGITLNVSLDSLVYGFTIRVSGQIELLSYRLREIFKNMEKDFENGIKLNRQALLQKYIRHHILIHEFVHRVQSLFVWIVMIQFLFSLITLCTSIFRMSKNSMLSAEFLSLSFYLCSMLFQVFFYCWYGNELELKSKAVADAAYSSNWTAATVEERKSLLFLMSVSQKGLNLSYYGIFALALNTFTWILKTSYSAFNLLQQMSD